MMGPVFTRSKSFTLANSATSMTMPATIAYTCMFAGPFRGMYTDVRGEEHYCAHKHDDVDEARACGQAELEAYLHRRREDMRRARRRPRYR